MQDVYFTTSWLLKHPSAVKRHKLKWDNELWKAVFYLPNKRLKLVRQSLEELLFDEVKLKPLLVDSLDLGRVRSAALEARANGNACARRPKS